MNNKYDQMDNTALSNNYLVEPNTLEVFKPEDIDLSVFEPLEKLLTARLVELLKMKGERRLLHEQQKDAIVSLEVMLDQTRTALKDKLRMIEKFGRDGLVGQLIEQMTVITKETARMKLELHNRRRDHFLDTVVLHNSIFETTKELVELSQLRDNDTVLEVPK